MQQQQIITVETGETAATIKALGDLVITEGNKKVTRLGLCVKEAPASYADFVTHMIQKL